MSGDVFQWWIMKNNHEGLPTKHVELSSSRLSKNSCRFPHHGVHAGNQPLLYLCSLIFERKYMFLYIFTLTCLRCLQSWSVSRSAEGLIKRNSLSGWLSFKYIVYLVHGVPGTMVHGIPGTWCMVYLVAGRVYLVDCVPLFHLWIQPRCPDEELNWRKRKTFLSEKNNLLLLINCHRNLCQ